MYNSLLCLNTNENSIFIRWERWWRRKKKNSEGVAKNERAIVGGVLLAGGAGGDWGQRVGSEYFVNTFRQRGRNSAAEPVSEVVLVNRAAAVVIYAFWPGNMKRFDEAAKLPLEDDPEPDNEKDD